MLNVIATIRAQPAHADHVAETMRKLAVASRTESGCHGYRVFRCADDAALFMTFEQWTDVDAEAAHMDSAHLAAAFAAAGPLLAAPPDIHRFDEI